MRVGARRLYEKLVYTHISIASPPVRRVLRFAGGGLTRLVRFRSVRRWPPVFAVVFVFLPHPVSSVRWISERVRGQTHRPKRRQEILFNIRLSSSSERFRNLFPVSTVCAAHPVSSEAGLRDGGHSGARKRVSGKALRPVRFRRRVRAYTVFVFAYPEVISHTCRHAFSSLHA